MDVTSSTLIGNKGLILNFAEGSTAYLIAFHPPGIFSYIWHHLSTWVFSKLWGRPQIPRCRALCLPGGWSKRNMLVNTLSSYPVIVPFCVWLLQNLRAAPYTPSTLIFTFTRELAKLGDDPLCRAFVETWARYIATFLFASLKDTRTQVSFLLNSAWILRTYITQWSRSAANSRRRSISCDLLPEIGHP